MERKADAVSEQTASQWRLKVGGGDQVVVKPGESLEIGRKPLRPLPDEGVARLEVEDSTKSMSKRHARFSVAENGDAVLRDLDSTNGSYVVTDKGELMRLPSDRDVPLDASPMRIQFGDVPVDFVRVEPDVRPTSKVPNLFDYSNAATVAARQEPDAADLSVDEILDLRAGEPTAVFDAQHTRAAAAVSPLTRLVDIDPIEPITFASITSAVEPDGRSEDSTHSDGSGHDETDETAPEGDDAAAVVFSEDDSRTDLPDAQSVAPIVGADGTVMPAVPLPDEPPADSVPLHVVEPLKPTTTRDLFADAKTGNGDAAAGSAADSVVAAPVATDSVAVDHAAADATTPIVVDATPQTRDVDVRQDKLPDAVQASQGEPDESAEPVASTAAVAPVVSDIADGVYTPAFESGSVFDKVAKGEFDKPQPQVVEVAGFTSDDARRTSDMTVQFEMARHPELLPFLAMNPALYDDLYAWLAAQGDPDIDEALANNEGYQDYRHAVGK